MINKQRVFVGFPLFGPKPGSLIPLMVKYSFYFIPLYYDIDAFLYIKEIAKEACEFWNDK